MYGLQHWHRSNKAPSSILIEHDDMYTDLLLEAKASLFVQYTAQAHHQNGVYCLAGQLGCVICGYVS